MFYYSNMETNGPKLIDADTLKKIYEDSLHSRKCIEEENKISENRNYQYSEPKSPSELRRQLYYQHLCHIPKLNYFVMSYPNGIIVKQGETGHYFRGENQIYRTCQPSLQRQLNKFDSEQDKETYNLIAQMRIEEFHLLLKSFAAVRLWEKNIGTIQYIPLAQHYGLETECLDITSDFLVALFFFFFIYDKNSNRWRPLKKSDTEKSEDTKYGLLYHAPSSIIDERIMMPYLPQDTIPEYCRNIVYPIGFQPFYRCESQFGYVMPIYSSTSLNTDKDFEKLIFRHSEKLSEWIFMKMDEGKAIYPEEGLSKIQNLINTIANLTTFSCQIYKKTKSKNDYFRNWDDYNCLSILNKFRLNGKPIKTAKSSQWSLSKKDQNIIDDLYTKKVLKIIPRLRTCYTYSPQ